MDSQTIVQSEDKLAEIVGTVCDMNFNFIVVSLLLSLEASFSVTQVTQVEAT